MTPPRVRIAPSPTGYFHVGTARTALFNWLYARQHGGVFVLRIEDTDRARNKAEHTDGIQRALRWLGLDWDEGPYFQSERGELYRKAIDELWASGHLYACDCTHESLVARVGGKEAQKGYDGHCRERGLSPDTGRILRFRSPDVGTVTFDELVMETKPVEARTIEDFGVRKSNGDPLFILANVVDDHDMAISHVIRGSDHLTNTSKYVLLWDALGYGDRPAFAHLPLIHNEQRKKLSKRRDKVAVEDYRDEGYLPEAVINYLALLGWAPGDDREILTAEQLVTEFRLEDVKASPAIFDLRKMMSVNAEYLRALTTEELITRAQGWLASRWAPLAHLVQERARTLGEVYSMTDFLYLPEPTYGAEWAKGMAKQPKSAALLDAATERYTALEDWNAARLQEATVEVAAACDIPQVGKAQGPIRLAITGRSVGPPLYESLELLGRDRTLARLASARERLDPDT